MEMREVTLFLVEDDDVDAMSIERGFNKQRIANPIVRAKDGKEALELLQNKQVPEPFIVVLDLNMPRMNGLELLTKIREDEELKHIVVFVLTTSKDDKDVISSYEKHIAGYFVKNEAGAGFQKVVEILDGYWKIVHLPVKHRS